nr:uncharacterized protein LOC102548730 [Rattus norvegicus]
MEEDVARVYPYSTQERCALVPSALASEDSNSEAVLAAQSPGITPAVQWITIPREDSLQIQARSTHIPHKSAVPLYPLHLQVRIQILRQCWQPREDSLQIQARSTLIPHKSAVPLYPLHLQVRIQILKQCWQPSHLASPLRSSGSLFPEDSLQIQARSTLIPHKSAVPLYPLHLQVRIQILRQCWQPSHLASSLRSTGSLFPEDSLQIQARSTLIPHKSAVPLYPLHLQVRIQILRQCWQPREDSLQIQARSTLLPHKSAVPLYPLHLQVRIQILRQCWQPSHLASPLRSSGSLFPEDSLQIQARSPLILHKSAVPLYPLHLQVRIQILRQCWQPREDSLQIQARSTLIPHKSAVPLYPLHLQVRIQILKQCWQPSHLASPLRSSGSLFPEDSLQIQARSTLIPHKSAVPLYPLHLQVRIQILRQCWQPSHLASPLRSSGSLFPEDSLQIQARSTLIPHKSAVPLYPLHLQVRIQILRQCWQPSHLASPLRSSGSLFPEDSLQIQARSTLIPHKSAVPLYPLHLQVRIQILRQCWQPREDSLQIQARSTLIPHKSAVPLYPLHLQVRIQILRQCWQPSHLASPLRSSGSLFPEDSLQIQARSTLIPHKSAVPLYPLHLQVRIQILRQCWQPSHLASLLGPVDHYSQSPGITPAVQWITIPREDSLQIQARSTLIPHKSAVPLYPLHLQVRIQILRQCWQPSHLASPLRSSGSLFPEDSLQIQARSTLIPHKSAVPLYPLHLQVRIQILRQCWQPSHLASPLRSSGSLFPEDSLQIQARSTLIPHKSAVPLYPLHLQVRIQILRQCWQPSLQHQPCHHYPLCSDVLQSPGITPAVQWITIPREDSLQIKARSTLIPHKSAVPLYPLHLQVRIQILKICWEPREDSLQIQARSPLIPHKSAVPLYPLHLQVRIQILRQCWQPSHLASPQRSSGSLLPVTWHHPCGPVDQYSQRGQSSSSSYVSPYSTQERCALLSSALASEDSNSEARLAAQRGQTLNSSLVSPYSTKERCALVSSALASEDSNSEAVLAAQSPGITPAVQWITIPREDSLKIQARSPLIPHKRAVPLYPLHLQVKIQILRQCWQPRTTCGIHLSSSDALVFFPLCVNLDNLSSPGIIPAFQWIIIPREDSLQIPSRSPLIPHKSAVPFYPLHLQERIQILRKCCQPREDSLQIQARSPLIPHKSAVPLYPLHLQVRIQVLRHCWQPSHLASPLRSSGSLILVIWHHPCIPVDHRTQSSGMTPAVQVITVLSIHLPALGTEFYVQVGLWRGMITPLQKQKRRHSPKIQAKVPLHPYKSFQPCSPLHLQVIIHNSETVLAAQKTFLKDSRQGSHASLE